MTDAASPVPPPQSGVFDPSRVADSHTAYLNFHDRLTRRLFDIGLRLHAMRDEFDGPDPTSECLRAAGHAVGDILESLDTVIREAGLAMLSLARDHTAPSDGDGSGSSEPR